MIKEEGKNCLKQNFIVCFLIESDPDCRRASSRGLIPKAKVKTIKMTFVIVFGRIGC